MCACSCDCFHACHLYPDGSGLHYTTINTAKTNNCFSLKNSPKGKCKSCLLLAICVCHSLTHVMSLGATLRLIRLDICPMLCPSLPLLWPRPSFIGHHWHSSDWYVSHTQCCSFWDWTNNHLCPAALTYNNVQYNRDKPDICSEICCSLKAAPSMELEGFRGGVGELFSALQEALHLEEHGRASLNRAIFMLAEQNAYNVKWVARCKETGGNMSRKQLFKSVW